MTREELAAWAIRNGQILIDNVQYEELCAAAAAAITGQCDLDRDFRILFGSEL